MKIRIVIVLTMMIITSVSTAQVYKKQVGLRLGDGVSWKVTKDNDRALETMVSFDNGGVQVSGFLQQYKHVFTDKWDDVWMYSGPGAHVGFTRQSYNEFRNKNHNNPEFRYERTYPLIGIDWMVGVEYRMPKSPFVFAIDTKPNFEIAGLQKIKLNLIDIALHIKFEIQ